MPLPEKSTQQQIHFTPVKQCDESGIHEILWVAVTIEHFYMCKSEDTSVFFIYLFFLNGIGPTVYYQYGLWQSNKDSMPLNVVCSQHFAMVPGTFW